MALRRTLVALLLVLPHTTGWALPAPLASFWPLCDEVLAWDEMAAYDGQLGKKAHEIQAKTASSARQISATRYEKVSKIISSSGWCTRVRHQPLQVLDLLEVATLNCHYSSVI